ncbi:hypothetical protein QBC35DRAFT_127009 [Podospora australis]|uniref:Mucin n=1 Tax=Podospora australis TaxID=1536484 RepID=A0AAN7AIB9_9PEZI|nr:hypothetical protein QBC35DRAFT_127009 [Podospora australis]
MDSQSPPLAEDEDATRETWPAAPNGLMALVDDMPWLVTDELTATRDATREEESSTPQTRQSFDLSSDYSSLELPFFNIIASNRTDLSPLHPHHQPHHPQDQLQERRTCYTNHQSSTSVAPHADCLPLFYTFFLSPSASTSSFASSVWSSGQRSGDSEETNETHTTMPGQILETDSDRSPPSISADYFAPSLCDTVDHQQSTTPNSQFRQQSSGPLFSRWARRHHHHPQSQSNQGHAPSKYHPGRGSLDVKPTSSKNSPKRQTHSRSSSIQKRQAQAGAVPQMTREEFEALPLAIQRKYFSTLERLRFAQESGLVDGISKHYDDIHNFRRRKPRQGRGFSEQIVTRVRRGSVLESHSSNSDSSPSYAAGSDITQETELTREKQVVLARRLRASVILDAADEAVYKLHRQASRRNLSPGGDTIPSPPSPRPNSMDSHRSFSDRVGQHGDVPASQSFYDSFRWLDEEEDLDLRLFLDDYHANLREGAPLSTKQKPSFRRHLSINKLPFGRPSISSSRPGTRDANSPISSSHTPFGGARPVSQTKRKSRALSLITPKHGHSQSITAFDPAAAHYQDPEARLKLRVYLASPQKFDEAVEFGFPSADVLSGAPQLGGDDAMASRRQSRQKLADGTSNMCSFLADDDGEDDENLSLNSDELSLADPDSPKTPEAFDSRPGGLRPARVGSTEPSYGRDLERAIITPESGGYVQAPASSREMTLRMTLTRPDLRAHEDEIYGWQQRQVYQQHSRRQTAGLLASEARLHEPPNGAHKESMEKFSNVDHWNTTNATEKGVMKRIWNRMRRS